MQQLFTYINLYIPQKQKMYDYCQQQCIQSQNLQGVYNIKNGYYGKPTKLRSSEPNMFQILTWNQQDLRQERQKQNHEKYNYKCKCSFKTEDSPQRVESANSLMPTAKKLKQSQNKLYGQQSKQKKQSSSKEKHITNKPQKNIDEQKKRPRSAAAKMKAVKIYNSKEKLPKFIELELKKQQEQIIEQPIQNKQKLIQKFKQTTRWIPNSSFTTYFGKPAFQNYGRGNTNPTFGGLMYGNYLKTHNIQPHRGINSPKNLQSYNVALMKGQQLGQVYPYPPKLNKKDCFVAKDMDQSRDLQCTQIYAQQNNLRSFAIHPPNLYELEKFGGKGIQKISKPRLQRSQIGKQNDLNYDEQEAYQLKQSIIGSRRQVY